MSFAGRLRRPFLLVALTIASSGCGAAEVTQVVSYDVGAPGIQAGYVGITPTATGLRILNQTARPIYFAAANVEILALWDIGLCTGGPNCPGLAQGQQGEIPWASVAGYSAEAKQFTVIWWQATVQPDGTARAENVHNVPVSR
jgi:hypothetical protein